MAALDEPLAKKIAKLFRMFGSPHENEAHTALALMGRLLAANGLSFNDIAVVLENANGEIEERKYSDTDAEIIFNRGVEKGRAEEARNKPKQEPSDFYDDGGQPQWHAIAMYCQQNNQRLESRHHEFVDDMAGSTMWREPTPKQGKYLLSLFFRLGSGRQ